MRRPDVPANTGRAAVTCPGGAGRPSLRSGFTLIEVMIVVAIIGIVAAIALPSYTRYVEKTRRIDATAFLSEVAGEQVRFFSENNGYAESMSELGYGTDDTHPSPEDHYVVSLEPLGGSYLVGFRLVATAATDGVQANDTDCSVISITSTGVRKPSKASGGGADCW